AASEGEGPVALVRPPARAAWSREAVAALVAEAAPGTLVGFDFAFGLPWGPEGPFPPGLTQPGDAFALWDAIDAACPGEDDLYAGPVYRPAGGLLAPFLFVKLTGADLWRGPAYDPERMRETERRLSPRPNSPYRIVGAKTVGPGSFAGMRLLAALRRRMGDRLRVWPFEPADPGRVTLCEIYPSEAWRAAGSGRSRDPETLRSVLAQYGARLGGVEPRSQDDYDALVGAAALRALPPEAFDRDRLPGLAVREGWIAGTQPAEVSPAARRAD
ncbi:MAG: hypothetical protein JO048_04325, partial [Methylobacteriaceae bacterium]|nr:hypothetical protein [Methylobacteriaceae bacterium]